MEEQGRSTEGLAEAAWRAGDFEAAATIVLEAYGAELYSFVLAQFRGSQDPADDVFSSFREDFWRGLPKFGWRCSMRAWCYRLARNAAHHFRRAPHNQRARRVPLSQSAFLDELVQRARTTTQPHLRSEVKDEFQRLREQLSQEEQDLLVLRVDRNLPWTDVAHAMLSHGDPSDEELMRRYEASLRQRFAEVKKRLRRLAQDAGLL
ncbi:MAG: sigma-70 family RNA polymerase sigma factor [Polyangiaceae bacterium]